jgi:hypothetical protein
MTIRIFWGDKNNVDFDGPLKLSPEERKRFFSLLHSLFEPVEEEPVSAFRAWRMGGDRIQYPRAWTEKEYETLLKSRTLLEAENKLARSGMAIIVQDGKWRPKFFEWCQSKGKNPFSGEMAQLIKQFMKEKAEELIARRNKRQVVRQKEKELLSLEAELKRWDSDEKRSEIEFLIQHGKIKKDYSAFIAEKKEEIKHKIAQLERNEKSEDE